MTSLVQFTAATPRHALPLLVAGQAQREIFVNEALARIDALLHPSVAGEATVPPPDPASGECWLVAAPAGGAWFGREEQVAAWDGTQWTFVAPVTGMTLRDGATGGRLVFGEAWQRIARPALPVGGATVDGEARAAIAAIIDVFATLSLIPQS